MGRVWALVRTFMQEDKWENTSSLLGDGRFKEMMKGLRNILAKKQFTSGLFVLVYFGKLAMGNSSSMEPTKYSLCFLFLPLFCYSCNTSYFWVFQFSCTIIIFGYSFFLSLLITWVLFSSVFTRVNVPHPKLQLN